MAKRITPQRPRIKTVSIRYEKLPSYNRFHVTNFTGSLSPDARNVSIELSVDAPTTPDKVNINLDEFGRSISETFTNSTSDQFIRYVHAGITIPMEVVPKFINWLQTKLDEYEEFISEGLVEVIVDEKK